MKVRLVASIVLIVVALGFAFYCLWRVESTAQTLAEALETAMVAAHTQAPNWQEATDEVVRLWESQRAFLHILMPHQNINELEWAIGALPFYLELGDVDLFVEHSVRGLQCLNTIREMERPTLGNIF